MKQLTNFITRYNTNQRKLAAGIALNRKSRPLRYIIARKDSKIKSLEMENELMRDFLSLTERK